MPAIPTPIIVAVSNLPWSNTADTVALDGTGSIPSTGNTITGYQWTIFEQPDGVTGTWPTDPNAAYLTNATTATPTLNNVLLPGSYGIILVVTDDNPDPKLDSSYTSHVPTQLTAAQDGLYGLDEGRFAGPIPSQIIWVRKEEQYSGLVKPGRGDRGWFSFTGGHWDLIDKIEEHAEYIAEEESGIRHYDEIQELTPSHGVVVEDVKFEDGEISLPDGQMITTDVGGVSITFGGTSGVIDISAPTSVEFTGGPIKVDIIEPYSPDIGVTVRGDGTHTYDLATDIITPESNNSYVTVIGKGTHTYDLNANSIKTNYVGGDGAVTVESTDDDLTLSMNGPTGTLTIEAPAGLLSCSASDVSITSTTTFGLSCLDDLQISSGTAVIVQGGTGLPDLLVNEIQADTGSNTGVTVKGSGTHTADLLTDIITPSTNDTAVTILGSGTHTADLFTDIIQPSTNSTSVTVRGKGTHTSDLSVDIIQADSNNSYVEILGKGTHTYDLVAAAINADGVAGGASGLMLTSGGTLTDVTVEGMDEVILDARGGVGSGMGVITAIGKLRAQGGTSSSRYRVPVGLASSAPGTVSNGSLNQVVYTFTLPANSLIVSGDSLKGKVTSSCVSNKSVKMRVKFGGNTIGERTASSGTTNMMIDFAVVAKSSSTQTATAYALETNAGGMYAHTALSVNCTSSTTITVEFDTSAASDETLETVSLELWCV